MPDPLSSGMAPEVPQSLSSSSSSSSLAEPDLSALQAAVQQDPTSYTAHAALVAALRTSASLPALRKARENFAAGFPLPPQHWGEWVSDELRLCETAAAKLPILSELYPRALDDYLCIDLHLSRIELAKQLHAAGALPLDSLVDAYHQSAFSTATGHFTRGGELLAAFESILPEEVAAARAEFPLRGVAVPRHDDTRDACEVFEARLSDARSKAPASEAPGTPPEQLVQEFRSYAAYARSVSHHFTVNVYERAVAECFLHDRLWAEYLRYVAAHGDPGRLYHVARRATRNVPWMLEAWAFALLGAGEARDGDAEKKVAEVLQGVVPHVMNSHDLAGAEWLCRAAWSAWKALGAPVRLRDRVWGSLDFNVAGSVEWARAVLHAAEVVAGIGEEGPAVELMKRVVDARREEGTWWVAYARLVVKGDGLQKARDVFRKGIQASGSVEEVRIVADAWAQFEGDCGEDEVALGRRVAVVLAESADKVGKVAAVATPASRMGRKERLDKKGRPDKGRNRNQPKKKRARTRDPEEKEDAQMADSNAANSEKVANGNEESAAGDESNAVEVDKGDEDDKMDGSGGVDESDKMKDEESVKKAGNQQTATGNSVVGKPGHGESKQSTRTVGEDGVEPRTIFVNYLRFEVTEEDLRQELGFAGKILDIRLPRRSDGASKGMAYIEFETEEGVEKALTRHMKPIKGRTAQVRRSKPRPRGSKKMRSRGRGAGRVQGRGGRRRVVVSAETAGDVNMADGSEAGVNGTKEGEAGVDKPKAQAELREMLLGKR